MAQTPEGRVKRAVSALLRKTPHIYYHMPVPGFGGGTTLDYIGSHMGRFFAIETKAPGKRLTERQEVLVSQIAHSGAKVFVIDGADSKSLLALATWLSYEGVTP